jgi:hypothetical protein
VRRLQTLATGARRTAGAALPDPQTDVALYRGIAQQALEILDPAGWRAFAHQTQATRRLVLTGSPDEVVARMAVRFTARGIDAQVMPLAAATGQSLPILVVLGERRPLDAERVAQLRRLALEPEPVALANVLTPETDAPLVEAYTTILRSADHTDTTLDVVVERILDHWRDLTSAGS